MFDEVDHQQRYAVKIGEGPVLIVAGPGTGKTKTLTARMAYLLRERQVPAAEIVALTFTKKAAHEMQQRLRRLFGDAKALPQVTTFHALGYDLLMHDDNGQKLVSELERQEIIRLLPKVAGIKATSVRELSLIISRAKTSLMPSATAEVNLLNEYEESLNTRGVYDFDDLLRKSYDLLKERKDNRPQYRYVLVDEFQDTSQLQYELLKILTPTTNIFAIGDPNQSIYAFRGAGAEMFDRFRRDFPDTTTIELTVNYRSCPQIISLANAIFPDSPQLQAHQANSGTVEAIQTLNEYSEAAYVLNHIEQGIGGSDMLRASGDQQVFQPRDYAILYRTHRAARAIQKAFAESGLPYQVAGEGSPYERSEIQTVINGLRYLEDPKDDNLPTYKDMKPMHIKRLLETVARQQHVNVHDISGAIAIAFGFAIDQDIRQFLNMLVQFGTDTNAALGHIADISQAEFYDSTINAVTLMTIHASKGLEFDHVFLIATEEGILPKLTAKGEGNIGEEQRLFYVAVTRARETLFILHAKFRHSKPVTLSRFVQELPESVLPKVDDPDLEHQQRKAKKRATQRAQGSLF